MWVQETGALLRGRSAPQMEERVTDCGVKGHEHAVKENTVTGAEIKYQF